MNKISEGGEFEPIHWPDEAAAVISDIKNHVRQIFTSSVLPSTEFEIYLNCETIESKKFTIRLSSDGFQVVGHAYNTNDILSAYPYETPYALLNDISPGYVASFGNELTNALLNLTHDSEKK